MASEAGHDLFVPANAGTYEHREGHLDSISSPAPDEHAIFGSDDRPIASTEVSLLQSQQLGCHSLRLCNLPGCIQWCRV